MALGNERSSTRIKHTHPCEHHEESSQRRPRTYARLHMKPHKQQAMQRGVQNAPKSTVFGHVTTAASTPMSNEHHSTAEHMWEHVEEPRAAARRQPIHEHHCCEHKCEHKQTAECQQTPQSARRRCGSVALQRPPRRQSACQKARRQHRQKSSYAAGHGKEKPREGSPWERTRSRPDESYG